MNGFWKWLIKDVLGSPFTTLYHYKITMIELYPSIGIPLVLSGIVDMVIAPISFQFLTFIIYAPVSIGVGFLLCARGYFLVMHPIQKTDKVPEQLDG